MRHVFVLGAVDVEGGGVPLRGPGQRAGQDVGHPRGLQVPSQEQRQNLRGIHALAIGTGQVARPVDVDDAGHAARLARVPAVPLESRLIPRDGQELREMTPGRSARHADPRRVDVIPARVRPQPAHGRLHVVDRGRELVLRREAVRDGRRNITALGEADDQVVIPLAASGPEPAAVDANHRREGALAGLRPREVELHVLAVGAGVDDPWLEGDGLGDLRPGGPSRAGEGQGERGREGERRDAHRGSAPGCVRRGEWAGSYGDSRSNQAGQPSGARPTGRRRGRGPRTETLDMLSSGA